MKCLPTNVLTRALFFTITDLPNIYCPTVKKIYMMIVWLLKALTIMYFRVSFDLGLYKRSWVITILLKEPSLLCHNKSWVCLLGSKVFLRYPG